MKVVKKENGKTIFTVELDEDEVGYIAVILGGATETYYTDNREYLGHAPPQYTNEMSSNLYGAFKRMFEGL